MFWSPLDDYSSSSSSDSEEFVDSVDSKGDYDEVFKNSFEKNHPLPEQRLPSQEPNVLCRTEQNPNHFVQEPLSGKVSLECQNIDDRLQTLLIRKDEYILHLKKLLCCQREQLYFFLKMSIKEDMLMSLKNTCEETDALYENENLSMALDRFKEKNDFPSEQTLLREDIFKTLRRLERLIKKQENLSGIMEKDLTSAKENTSTIDLYQYTIHETYENRLLQGTQQLYQSLESLRIQLKRIGLIEDERIHLIERVYSLPTSQRQLYGHLMMLEKDKLRLNEEIGKLKEKRKSLKGTAEFLEESVSTKIADFDLNRIKPGLETHVKIMELVEKGELSLITMTKDEKGRFKDEYTQLWDENTELTKKLKDYDRIVLEREDLRKQVNVLVDNCLQMEKEVRDLRRNNRTEELLNELKETYTHKDQLRVQLDKIVKDGPAVLRVCGEPITKIVEERDQLRLKLTEYLSMEEDIKLLKLRAAQADVDRKEAEKLRVIVSELEEIKVSYMALVDKNGHNLDVVTPGDREKYRNMCKELNYLKQVEIQKERLTAENLKCRQTLDRQETEIKEMLDIIDKLALNLKIDKGKKEIPVEGLPEGPDAKTFLSQEDKNKIEKIRDRILYEAQKSTKMKIQVVRKSNRNSGGLSILLNIFKYFLKLGLSLRRGKSSNVK